MCAVPTAPAAWLQRAGLGADGMGTGHAAGERGRRAFMLAILSTAGTLVGLTIGHHVEREVSRFIPFKLSPISRSHDGPTHAVAGLLT